MLLNKKTSLLLIALVAMGSFAFTQTRQIQETPSLKTIKVPGPTKQPGLQYPDYPVLELPDAYRHKDLPAVVDNSSQPYLRPIFTQQGASCGQSASVAYNFCYEIDRAREVAADTSINQYPSHFTWNFMNASEYYGIGVSYFHSFEVLRTLGCPNEAVYGPITLYNPFYWMSGYDKYLHAMHNRISGVRSINLATPDGLLTLKHWLNDHLDGSAVGGTANFYTGITTYTFLPSNSPEAGKGVIIDWYTQATHALTIVGYNDSIRYDLNHDGKYTNNLDIDADGLVTIRDWEIGGIKFVNSYGTNWGNDGFCYALYSTLAKQYGQGGIWNNAAHIITVDPQYSPLLTLKATVNHTMRGRLRIRAGVNADTSASLPSVILDLPVFDYQGGDYYMQGGYTEADKDIEIGLDITPLAGAMESGKPARFFLMVDENDPKNQASGSIKQFSVISYPGDTVEYGCIDAPCSIAENDRTYLSITVPGNFPIPEIDPSHLPPAMTGQPYSCQLNASSGYPPYQWNILQPYAIQPSQKAFSAGEGSMLNFGTTQCSLTPCALPFHFSFYGKEYDTVYVHTDGYLMLEKMTAPYPYLKDQALYLSQIRSVAPYLNDEQQLYGSEAGVWFQADSGQAVFTWILAGTDTETGGYNRFKATLFPDGRITYAYGAMEAKCDLAGVTGVSNGDGLNYQYCEPDQVADSRTLNLHPCRLPDGLNISQDGLISADTITGDFTSDLHVCLTDSRRIRKIKQYNLTTGPEVAITVASGDDVEIEAGETASLSAELLSALPDTLQTVSLKLRSLSPHIVVTDSVAEGSELMPGQSLLLSDAFRFSVPGTYSENRELNFILIVNWDGHSAEKTISFPVILKEYRLSSPFIVDQDNNMLDAGETSLFQVRLSLGGAAPADTFNVRLQCEDPYISVLEPSVTQFRNTPANRYAQAEWMVHANPSTPRGRIVQFALEAISTRNDTLRETLPLIVGKPSIMLVDLDKNYNSGWHIIAALKKLHVSADEQPILDTNIFQYDQLFLCLGTRPLNYTLDQDEGNLLDTFLEMGRNVYLEGGSAFGGDPHLPVHERFMVEGSKQSWQMPADTLTGNSDSFGKGLTFDYKGEHVMQYCLLPVPPANIIFTDKNSGFHFVVSSDSASYRTIASSVEFGGIFPYGTTTWQEIIRRYLRFMRYDPEPLAANFTAGKYEGCTGSILEFSPNCAGSPGTYHWIFENGNPAESFEQTAQVSWQDSGVYSVSLIVSDSTTSDTLTRHDLVRIVDCSGIEPGLDAEDLWIFPNPATEKIFFRLTADQPGKCPASLIDAAGRLVRTQEFVIPSGFSQQQFDLHGLGKGFYILHVRFGNSTFSRKILIR